MTYRTAEMNRLLQRRRGKSVASKHIQNMFAKYHGLDPAAPRADHAAIIRAKDGPVMLIVDELCPIPQSVMRKLLDEANQRAINLITYGTTHPEANL